MNWGEPWYAGFRESQTEYRMKNQKYFQRNLMPGMLGWFSMRNNTPVEDIEWMLARSAAYNAGYAFVAGERQLKTNGQSDRILELIGEWEKARMADAFSEEQKERMKDINTEFSLTSSGENTWKLRQIHSFKYKHESKIRQPGEPLFSSFSFSNPESDVTLQFSINAQDADISSIKLELDNSREINIPVSLKAGETLKYSGSNTAVVLDKYLNKIKDVDIDASKLDISKGEHKLVFDCAFNNNSKDPAAKIELRIPGKEEEIKDEQIVTF
jgi:hypothetical protein